MTIRDVVSRHSKRYTVHRPTPATVTDGFAVAATPDTFVVKAHVQPLSPKELRNLEPGQNGSDWRNVWCLSLLKLRDRIKIESQWYTVQREETWVEGEFWHVQVVRAMDTL